MVYRNTGSGGSVQLVMLTERSRNGSAKLAGGSPSATDLAREAIASLRVVKEALGNESVTVPAREAFTGVLLPDGAELELPNAYVRPVKSEERDVVPENLRGQLSGADSEGRTVL